MEQLVADEWHTRINQLRDGEHMQIHERRLRVSYRDPDSSSFALDRSAQRTRLHCAARDCAPFVT